MKGLAKEQERLRGETEEMLQKLRRNRTDGATRDLQAAVDQMEAARDDLERGQTPAQPQGDAIDKLEQARDRLDQGAKPDARELSRETRRKLADQVRALRDRQAAAVTEADRLVTEAQRVKGWTRPLQASLDDLAGRERSLAPEVRGLIDKRFDNLPVLQRLLNEAADSLEVAEQRIGDRLEDIVAADANQGFDAKVEADAAARFRTPMTRALRRLDQLLDALKDEEKPKASPPEPGMETPPPMGDAGEEGDLVPPLAQLKVLRALQQELNERTARFAKDHPDAARLTPEEQDELKELEQAQRDIAGLFEEVAAMVPMKPEAP